MILKINWPVCKRAFLFSQDGVKYLLWPLAAPNLWR